VILLLNPDVACERKQQSADDRYLRDPERERPLDELDSHGRDFDARGCKFARKVLTHSSETLVELLTHSSETLVEFPSPASKTFMKFPSHAGKALMKFAAHTGETLVKLTGEIDTKRSHLTCQTSLEPFGGNVEHVVYDFGFRRVKYFEEPFGRLVSQPAAEPNRHRARTHRTIPFSLCT
jgi:hypothetical protein